MAVAAEQITQVQPEAGSENTPQSSGKVPSVDDFVGELLARIQPAPASELRRKSVAEYVQNVISRAFQPGFEVKAFTYGSVPLKTYLPDGDIDLAIFQNKRSPQQLRDTWFIQLSNFLQREEHNPTAYFRVREVHVIHAEVKLVKCLVDNIVVDISFQSLGGLCTVNFLESIDRRIDDHHLFKRSIILVKAWCYYESRLLGAHHGLISTYALETMVLYIFMVYHRTVTTPLKVLHKFLKVFSSFDWDTMCLSLQGPIPLTTFPDPKPLPFPEADGPPLLKEDFMADMRHLYSPPGFSADGAASTTPRSFQLKYLNVMDPLLPTNNLGRSVNKSSFARIRRALDYGARRLTAILEMDPSEGIDSARAFFRNTWNAQRCPQPSQRQQSFAARPDAAAATKQAQQVAEAQRPGYPPQRSLTPLAGGNSKAAHGLQPANGVPNGWQSMQAVQIPQVLAGTTAPLLIQQLMHMQLGQQQLQLGQQGVPLNYWQQHPSLPAESAAAARRFAQAYSQPANGQPAEGTQAARPRATQAQRQAQPLPQSEAMDAGVISETADAQLPSSGAGQNGASHLRHSQPAEVGGQGKKGQQPSKSTAAPSLPSIPSSQSLASSAISAAAQGPGNGTHDRPATGNGHTWKEPPSQPHIPNGVGAPQTLGYLAVMPGGQQRVVQLPMTAVQVPAGRVHEFFQLPYPYMVPNGAALRVSTPAMPPYSYAQVPPSLNLQLGLAGQRHSDPGTTAPPDMLEPADVTLSGDLERLSQHLQSARAMYDSNPGSSAAAARGEGPGAAGQKYADGSTHRQSYAQQQQQQQQQPGQYHRAPTRSSSAGNLNTLRSASFPNGVRRPAVAAVARQDAGSGSSLPADVHLHHPSYAAQGGANGTGPRPRYTAVQPQPESYGSVQLAMPLEPHQDVPTRPASERGPSRAHSPVKAANGNHAHRDHGISLGPKIAQAASLAEWPLPGSLKGNGRVPPAEYANGSESGASAAPQNGRTGWSTASEGRPGWASPVGSTLSEQSLASLRGLRANGMSPAPASPSLRGASLRSVQSAGSYEGQHGPVEAHENGSSLPPEGGKHWQSDFVLAEEDFPTLPSVHSQVGTPIKGVPKPAAGWVAPEAKGVQSTS